MASLAELDAPDLSSWSLTLVNQWNPLSRDNTFTPEKLSNGLVVDQRCYRLYARPRAYLSCHSPRNRLKYPHWAAEPARTKET